MYSILVSKFDIVYDSIKEELKKIINTNMKVAIIPWAFPVEIDSDTLESEYFPVNGRRFNKYAKGLYELGIKLNNIYICNCYKDSKEKIKKEINDSDILVIPGGNPEMLFSKILHSTEILYDIKNYKGIIIGESAGCELQLKRYFITKENNYYGYLAFYDGIGVLNDPFYMDVHTQDTFEYKSQLIDVANKTKKTVYAIYDEGAIIYNRETNNFDIYGKVEIINPELK